MSLLHIQKRWLQKNLKRKLPKCTAYVEMSPPTEEAAVIGINGSPCLEPVKLWMELTIEREKKLKLGFWLDINCPQLLITSHLEDDKPSWPEIKCSVSVRSLEMSMESFLCLTHSVPIKKNKKNNPGCISADWAWHAVWAEAKPTHTTGRQTTRKQSNQRVDSSPDLKDPVSPHYL